MLSFLRNIINKEKPEDYVSSIDQLADSRSRTIVSSTGLDIDAIYPLCTEMNFEISAANKQLYKSVADENKASSLNEYRLKLAAAAVLAYELSQKESMTFPKPVSSQVNTVPKKIISALKKRSWQAGRLGSAQEYEIMGKIFEENLRVLEENINLGKIEVDIEGTHKKLFCK